MPDGPNTWAQLLAAGGDLARHAWAAAMGSIGAVLGFIYRHDASVAPLSWQRLCLESLSCGFIAVTISYGMESFGMPISMGNFIGGVLGFMGAKAASEFGEAMAKRKTGG